jgi:hypothetical protein
VHPDPLPIRRRPVDFTLHATVRASRIAVYDVKGALVKTARRLRRCLPASTRTRWNGVDEQGRSAASGIYFVRMIAGSYSEVRKIVMLK